MHAQLRLTLLLALFCAACGGFDGYDDGMFDFPAQPAPPVPHPAPPEPEKKAEAPSSQAAAKEVVGEDAPKPPEGATAQPAEEVKVAVPVDPAKIDSEPTASQTKPPIDAPHKNVGLKPKRPASQDDPVSAGAAVQQGTLSKRSAEGVKMVNGRRRGAMETPKGRPAPASKREASAANAAETTADE